LCCGNIAAIAVEIWQTKCGSRGEYFWDLRE
jgi:hypothetical protein